nr:hypothetical protein [Tanacetum cinerariifolium]
MSEGVVPVGNHEMEDAEDDVLILDRLHRKRTRPLVQVDESSSAVVGEELKNSSTSVVPLNVTPSIIVYPVSDDDEHDKGGGSGELASASQGDKDITPEDLEDPNLRNLPNILDSFDRSLMDITHEYAYLRRRARHSQKTLKANEVEIACCLGEEVAGLKSQITELEAEALQLLLNCLLCSPEFSHTLASLQRSVMSLGAHLLSTKILKKVRGVLRSALNLDEGAIARVFEEGSALCTRLWPYFLELITRKDEDINGLLAIRAPPDVDACYSSQVHLKIAFMRPSLDVDSSVAVVSKIVFDASRPGDLYCFDAESFLQARILLTLHEDMTAVMTIGFPEGIKASHGMVCGEVHCKSSLGDQTLALIDCLDAACSCRYGAPGSFLSITSFGINLFSFDGFSCQL